jgi:hypothetical protein
MQNLKTISKQTIKALSLITCASAFTLVTAVGAQADDLTPPRVPDAIQVPPEAELFLIGHGVGTQNYVCVPSGSGFAFTLFTPQATLFTDDRQQIIHHFFSPNPFEGGTIRVTWEDSRDTSTVWGFAAGVSTDRAFVRKDAVAWLRVDISGAAVGPTGGDTLTGTKFVQRINTVGGLAPAELCVGATDIGKKAFVPYEADYLFYKVNTTQP